MQSYQSMPRVSSPWSYFKGCAKDTELDERHRVGVVDGGEGVMEWDRTVVGLKPARPAEISNRLVWQHPPRN